MAVETRYHRSDTHTINGLTAYQLKITNSASIASIIPFDPVMGSRSCSWRSNVVRRQSGGSETTIGSSVAQVSRATNGSGYQSNTWACPQTTLNPTDAIKVIEYLLVYTTESSENFITEQLGAYSLTAATWTFTRWTYRDYDGFATDARLDYGSSTRETKIENFTYSTTPTTSIKTIIGVAKASVKTVNGVAIASVKTWNGLA